MKPFICNGKRFAFDITNPYDLTRLQKAADRLSQGICMDSDGIRERTDDTIFPDYLCPGADADINDTARGVLQLCRCYYAFFAILFPGQADFILGDRPSVSAGRDAFGKWMQYLQDCLSAERAANAGVIHLYDDMKSETGSGTEQQACSDAMKHTDV